MKKTIHQPPMGMDVSLINRRLEMLQNVLNENVGEINNTGRLVVSIEKAFRNSDDMIKLAGQVALLKVYADAAAKVHGENMTLETWCDIFNMMASGCHILPSGAVQ